jgi:predicted Fe-Mo cluster-binding NifX family protein
LADPAAILRTLQSYNVNVLAVQELTPRMVSELAAAGLEQLLPFSISIPDLVRQAPGCGHAGRWPRCRRCRV